MSEKAGAVNVMGVAGCGKSTLAEALARSLGWTLIEADRFHSTENRARMHAGIALTDEDRINWLSALSHELEAHTEGVVLSCSALKRRYRDILREARGGLRFIYLEITPALARQRVQARAPNHFFSPALVESQFATLEPPVSEPDVLWLDASRSLPELHCAALEWITPVGG